MTLLLLSVLFVIVVVEGYFHRSGTLILDEFGRQRIFHGVNVVVKQPPYIPQTMGFDTNSTLSTKDFALLERWGFNMIRLGTMWPGVAPIKGMVNG